MEILFALGLLAIVGFGLWSMRETNKFVDEQNRQIRLQRAFDRVDKDIKQLTKVNDEYLNFIRTKRVVEEKLLDKVNQMANAISNRLERLSKARQWDTNFNSFNAKEDGVEYFTNKLDEVCYQEAKEHIKKGHKLYHALKEKRDNCKVIVHTGSDINSTVKTLQKEMASADIKLAIPEQLLQIAVK